VEDIDCESQPRQLRISYPGAHPGGAKRSLDPPNRQTGGPSRYHLRLVCPTLLVWRKAVRTGNSEVAGTTCFRSMRHLSDCGRRVRGPSFGGPGGMISGLPIDLRVL